MDSADGIVDKDEGSVAAESQADNGSKDEGAVEEVCTAEREMGSAKSHNSTDGMLSTIGICLGYRPYWILCALPVTSCPAEQNVH